MDAAQGAKFHDPRKRRVAHGLLCCDRPLGGSLRLKRTSQLATVLLLVVLAAAAGAQDTATGIVAGRITDASGKALAGARVAATRVATGTAREATTDSNGAFVLTNLAPGEYRVAFEAEGFSPRTADHALVQVG